MDAQSYTNQDKGEKLKCLEKDSPTQKSISTIRQTYCATLKTCKSDKAVSEKAYQRYLKIYWKKKRLFEWTEKNYRIYRDLDICLDTELTTGNTSLTESVKTYNAINADLYNNLKSIVASVKVLKTKVYALREQALNLEHYKTDQCNATQWALLTGKNADNCKGDDLPPLRERPDACKDAENIYGELISIPKKVLAFDVDSLLQSSADTVGIQTFSNITTLTTLQVNLTSAGADFVKHVSGVAKLRAADMITVQNDLVTAIQDCTKAGIDEYNKISICSGAHHTVQYLCSPDCKCVKPCQEHPHHPRLADCECKICCICEVVKNTYKGGDGPNPDEDCGCS